MRAGNRLRNLGPTCHCEGAEGSRSNLVRDMGLPRPDYIGARNDEKWILTFDLLQGSQERREFSPDEIGATTEICSAEEILRNRAETVDSLGGGCYIMLQPAAVQKLSCYSRSSKRG